MALFLECVPQILTPNPLCILCTVCCPSNYVAHKHNTYRNIGIWSCFTGQASVFADPALCRFYEAVWGCATYPTFFGRQMPVVCRPSNYGAHKHNTYRNIWIWSCFLAYLPDSYAKALASGWPTRGVRVISMCWVRFTITCHLQVVLPAAGHPELVSGSLLTRNETGEGARW